MKKIQMVDLLSQYDHIKEEIDQALTDVVRSSWYVGGPDVREFQNELQNHLEVKHVIPCANGTDALQIALMALNLKRGDEVIVPAFTYVASAEAIALLGLTPILVDVDPKTFNIDLNSFKNAITPATKAVIPVHLFGQTADMEEVMKIAEEHKLYVIEDAAQSINSKRTFSDGSKKYSGTIGHIGTTSFFPSKNLGCFGDGGAIFTNDDQLAAKIRMVANHGSDKRYYHDEIGVNSRLDSIQAAVLRIKLRKLNDYTRARQEAASKYDSAFEDNPNLIIPFRDPNSTHVFHQYTLKYSGDRDGLQKHLNDLEIPAMIYYPLPLHEQKAYKSDRYSTGDFPVTEKLCKEVISLPMHTELTDEQIDFITSAVNKFTNP